MRRIIVWTALVCLVLTAASARADEEGLADKLLNESGWTLWEISWGLNTDFEMCSPEEMDGNTVMGLSRSGKGFVYSEKGTLTFDWSEKQTGGLNLDLMTSAEKEALGLTSLPERLEINNGSAFIESFMGGLKVYGRTYNQKTGVPYVVFVPADQRNQSEKLTGSYLVEGTAGEAMGFDSQAVIHFEEDGTVRQGFADEELDLLMTAFGDPFYGEWIILDEKLMVISDQYDGKERFWEYQVNEGWISIKVGELPAQIELPIYVPLHYDSPKRFEEMAGTWCGSEENSCIVYRLDEDGTGEYAAIDRLLDPKSIYEAYPIEWQPMSGGIKAWAAGKRGTETELTILNGRLQAEYNGILHELIRMPRYGALLDSEEKTGMNAGILTGVWELKTGGGYKKAQLRLNPNGSAEFVYIPAVNDPREQKLMRENGCGWVLTEGGISICRSDEEILTLSRADDMLISVDGASFRQTVDYSAWNGKEYPYEELLNYMDTGLVGVWKCSIYHDMDTTGDFYTLYLAADGDGLLEYSRGSDLRAQSVPIEWRAEDNGFRFCAAAGEEYLPYLERGEWYTTKLGRSGKTCDWRTSYGFGATFNQISEFWAFPEDSVLDGPIVKYELLDDGTARLTDYFGFDKEIEIPAVVDGYAVSELGSGLFSGNMQAERVILPEGVRKIGSEAFLNCSNLTSIEFPSTLSAIGDKAFSGCEALTAVNISDCRIGERAFFRCSGLKTVVVSGATAVENSAFADCAAIETLDLTGLYGSIGEGGFAYCGISVLRLPDYPIKLGKDIFGNSDMTEVVIPGGMKKIADWMFEGCWYLEKVTISEGIEEIGEEAFANCPALTEISLPSTLETIGQGAFSRCTALTAVSLPEGVVTLGDSAFGGCSALKVLVLPASLESIGMKAFVGCEELNELHIPGAQTQIAEYVLNQDKIVIVGSAGSTAQAYAQKYGLTFKDSAGAAVSTNVSNTADFILSESSDGTLCITQYKGAGGEVIVPDSVDGKQIAVVGTEAFIGNESVRSVVLPDTVREIGDKAFFGCKNLESVRIPASAAQFGRFIFTNCPKLVVQVDAGSQAEAYADSNRLKKEVQ